MNVIDKGTFELESVTKTIINHFNNILDRLCNISKTNINKSFVNLVIKIIIESTSQSNEILKSFMNYIPHLEHSQMYEKNESLLIDLKNRYFRALIKQLLLHTNNESQKSICSSLIELSLTSKILTPLSSTENKIKGGDWPYESMIVMVLKERIITTEGEIFFSPSQYLTICYRKSSNTVINEINYYIDYDSILSKFVWFYAKVVIYQLNNEYFAQYDSHWNSFELSYSDITFIDQYINTSLNSLYLLPKEHLVQFIQIFCSIFKNNILPNDITRYNSIINFIITCNYLINYQSIDFYINSLEEQTNEVYYIFEKELKLKETILNSIIDIVATTASNNIIKYFHLFSLFTFYFNSTLDQPIEDTSIFKKTNVTLVYLTQIIICLLNNKSGIEEHFVILSILYLLRDLIQYSDSTQLIN